MNFGMLRVLNDDFLKPNKGFGAHSHKNMEIISIPIAGVLSHKDSMGNTRSIAVGEVQVMSAGTGITHSEFNDSDTDSANFLQLWIFPEVENVVPYYDQKEFDKVARKNNFQVLVSPRGSHITGSLPIYQQGYIAIVDLDQGIELSYCLKNNAYFFLIEGEVTIENEVLQTRDAVGFSEVENVAVKAQVQSILLVIDVP
jgi:hypothetical protein